MYYIPFFTVLGEIRIFILWVCGRILRMEAYREMREVEGSDCLRSCAAQLVLYK